VSDTPADGWVFRVGFGALSQTQNRDPASTSPGLAPLQPDKADLTRAQVPVSWLAEEHLSAAERVDRLACDYDLVTDLAFRRFEGPRYDYFANELAKYGIAVIRGWIRRRLILARCRERGFGGLPEPPVAAFDDPEIVDGLTDETVAMALRHFRDDVLIPGRWDYRKGASLRTFFIGQCLIRFANVYRSWWRQHGRRTPDACVDPADLCLLDQRTEPDLEALVLDQIASDRLLSQVKDVRVRRALVMAAAGIPQREIAERLRCTTKAVERMLANERARMRRRGIA
jgi:hypothetical protein